MLYRGFWARVERDASMGWFWTEAWDDELGRWVGARMVVGVGDDTFLRREPAERMARGIDACVAALAASALLAR